MTNEELIAHYTSKNVAISFNERGNPCCTLKRTNGHIWELLTDGTWRDIVSHEVMR